MIIVVSGAIGAGNDLRAIAERLVAAVVTHLQGRRVIDSRHPLSVGRAEAFPRTSWVDLGLLFPRPMDRTRPSLAC
jgi:thiamine pyrophosphate-dependent acetolactate synthase large subunit-like protein